MTFLLKRFSRLNVYLKIIVVFCLIGMFYNAFSLWKYSGHFNYIKIYFGFFIIYLMQVILILLRDQRAALFSLMQCFFAFFAVSEYTFFYFFKPIFNFIKYLDTVLEINYFVDLRYTLVSIVLSLEFLKTMLMYDFLKHEKK